MEEVTTTKNFSPICIERGFTKRKNVYSRCIGDGIFQNLSFSPRRYNIDPKSPEYTDRHQKSYTLEINFWSMYADLPEEYFSDGRYYGNYGPVNFLGKRVNSLPFYGLRTDYQIMIEKGFDFLDSVNTQRKLLDAIDRLDGIEFGGLLPHRTELCAPYLICGDWLSAYSRLTGQYTQSWLAFHSRNDHLRDTDPMQYLQKEAALEQKLEPSLYLLNIVLGKNKDKIVAYLRDCFCRNLHYAQKNNIAFSKDFAPLDFVKDCC